VSKDKPLIAVVDDDESVWRAVKRLIRSMGMNADTFLCGQDFLNLLGGMPAFHPDCVVLDLHMPGMNGLEVQSRLARADRKLPVIFITAHDETCTRELALARGAAAYLRKPFNDAHFAQTLDAVLRSAAAMSEAGDDHATGSENQ
jgi:FixJ family two-component response regulator